MDDVLVDIVGEFGCKLIEWIGECWFVVVFCMFG